MDPDAPHNIGNEPNARSREPDGRQEKTPPLEAKLQEQIRLRNRAEKRLRVSEERYRVLAEMSPIETIIVDEQGRITRYNLATASPGSAPPKVGAVLFRDWSWGADDQQQMHEHLLACIATGKSEEFPESRCGERFCHIKIAPISGGAVITAIDITDRKRAEEELRQSQDRLRQSQKMEALGTLVAGLAHEINNPLNMVIYNIPLLKKVFSDLLPFMEEIQGTGRERKFGGLTVPFLKENLGRLLSDIDMAANRVAKIVSDLKNFARRSDGTEKEPIDLNLAVGNALRLARPYVEKNRALVETELAETLPRIDANLQSIEQVIVNILINAVQSTEPGKGRIRVQSGLAPDTRKVFFSVSDNGRGIDQAMAGILFDPFVTDRQAEGGTGLGLAVSYQLVKDNDGEITFASRPGEGTNFTARFPALGLPQEARILVVDDDESIRRILVRALTRQRPYKVDTAENGIDACIRLGTLHPDLLILDIFMPDMDGLEVCRAIRKDPSLSDMKVLITTGFPAHEKLREVADLGFSEIQSKPFRLGELIRTVDDLLSC